MVLEINMITKFPKILKFCFLSQIGSSVMTPIAFLFTFQSQMNCSNSIEVIPGLFLGGTCKTVCLD